MSFSNHIKYEENYEENQKDERKGDSRNNINAIIVRETGASWSFVFHIDSLKGFSFWTFLMKNGKFWSFLMKIIMEDPYIEKIFKNFGENIRGKKNFHFFHFGGGHGPVGVLKNGTPSVERSPLIFTWFFSTVNPRLFNSPREGSDNRIDGRGSNNRGSKYANFGNSQPCW
jgi:hypothetical protein